MNDDHDRAHDTRKEGDGKSWADRPSKKHAPRKVVYVAHPLSDPNPELRAANLRDAAIWCVFAVHAGYAPVADWIILASQWDESMRDIGLAVDFTLIKRCDEVWLLGPRISPGMQLERELAQTHGIVVRDFTNKTPEAVMMFIRAGVFPTALELP